MNFMKGLNKYKGGTAIKNIGYMSIAQMFVMLLSMGMSIFVPKFVGVTEFSYWQLFIFYASYTGCLHLGLNDGLYLKLGGKQLSDTDKTSITNQLWCSIAIQTIILVVLFFILYFLEKSPDRRLVYLYICIYAVINNVFNYCGSVLQAINQIKNYSECLIVDKVFVIIYIFVILLLNYNSYNLLIWGYIVGRALALSLLLHKNKSIFLNFSTLSSSIFKEMQSNISVGYNLMIANIASSFILGVGRFVVDLHYPIEIFGKVSFAFTLTGFVLALISQVGNSIFPVLATKDNDFHRNTFPAVENLLQLLLPISYLAYPFVYALIHCYLPQYIESLSYFIILYPLCVFEAKNSMLYNTYMKVLRLERKLLRVNLMSVAISAILVLLSYHLFKNIYLIVLSLVVAVIIKAFCLRLLITRQLEIRIDKPNIDLIISTMCVFIMICDMGRFWIQLVILMSSVILYEFIFRTDFKEDIHKLFIK